MIVALMTDSAGRTASVHYDYILKHQFLQLHVYVAIEGFVVYTGRDYGLHLNVMITYTRYGRT